jgi:hypothetical protein
MSPTSPAFYARRAVTEWRRAKEAFSLSVHGFRWLSRLEVMAAALIKEVQACSKTFVSPDCNKIAFSS